MCRRFLFFSLFPAVVLTGLAQEPRVTVVRGEPDLNELILTVIRGMPEQGAYSASAEANRRLATAIVVDAAGLSVDPARARPSYCSGATYLVFVGVLRELMRTGKLSLVEDTLGALAIHGQRDGEGVWGRWNANGPGTARLFAELGLGRNFTDWSKARPGDFMKVFWSDEIGKLERGHSVIYMGTTEANGVENVKFWSSNQPLGYGYKLIPRSKVIWAVFSRLENPAGIARIKNVAETDAYLASLLRVRSTQEEVKTKCAAE